jgi:hypothetical protein
MASYLEIANGDKYIDADDSIALGKTFNLADMFLPERPRGFVPGSAIKNYVRSVLTSKAVAAKNPNISAAAKKKRAWQANHIILNRTFALPGWDRQ